MLEKFFQPENIESEQFERWERSGAFKSDAKAEGEPFCIMMPPPNVTGTLHMGHALNHTLQDIMVRYNRMKGRNTLWQPGTDHASIAVHMVLEKQLAEEGKTRQEIGRKAFMEKAWRWKEYSSGAIQEQLRRFGTTPDWSRERFTMDDGLSKAVSKAFVQLYKEGLIYRDKRLVNWDPERKTVISDLEVNYKEVKGKLYHFRYPFEDGSGHISIATTRPETILADGAVAVHPEDERYKDLVGKFVIVPIVNRIIPIIADEYVEAEFGSGAVKITAAHDFNDFEVYKRHQDKGIPLINLFTPDAKMNENCPEEYIGLDRFEARDKVVADFDDLEYLEKIEDHVHQIPVGERSGIVVEPYLTDQWYCDAPALAKPAIEAVETGKMEFVPKNWENTYFEWMRNIQPWCISRQLWWGHQIPAWYGPEGDIFVAETEEEAQKQANEKYGEEVRIKQDEDVLDTWFSSGLWPFSTLGWPDNTEELKKYYPTDVLFTAFDIIFFWVARMMMFGLHFMGDVPFRTVYMHALVRDSKGQKMSKSKGNVVDPLELMDKYGTDSLRFTMAAMAAPGRDVKMSEERVEGYRNFATKIWNATRYCEMNQALPVEGYDPAMAKHPLNRWIISSLLDTNEKIEKAIAHYRFNDAASSIYQFVWGTFCDWYLEFTKPVLNAEKESEDTKKEIRETTGWILDQILLLLNPFMPFITEELYKNIAERKGSDCLLTQNWPEYPAHLRDEKSLQDINWLARLITEIRSVRSDMNVPASSKIQLLVKAAHAETKEKIALYQPMILQMARIENIEFVEETPKGAIQTVLDEATLILPIADIIDLDKERARLKKEIEKLELDIKKIGQKLENKKFIENAPDEIVEEQRHRKQEAECTLNKLSQALNQLEAA